jgi:hypothetical protein
LQRCVFVSAADRAFSAPIKVLAAALIAGPDIIEAFRCTKRLDYSAVSVMSSIWYRTRRMICVWFFTTARVLIPWMTWKQAGGRGIFARVGTAADLIISCMSAHRADGRREYRKAKYRYEADEGPLFEADGVVLARRGRADGAGKSAETEGSVLGWLLEKGLRFCVRMMDFRKKEKRDCVDNVVRVKL